VALNELRGSCHCGNISFTLQWPEDAARIPARRCGCTFCAKHGGVWTSHPQARLTVRISDAGHVARYSFGTGTADFMLCARCGVAPLVTSHIEGVTYAVVNVNTFDDVDPARLDVEPASFEGEELQSRLERRRSRWIADVVLREGA
jgi:hypothetical protein